MAAYARRIGADYIERLHDPFTSRFGLDPRWFDKLRPAFDPAFARYDRILVVDHDVFPVAGLSTSIFAEVVADFGMVEEPEQPAMRAHPQARIFTTEQDVRWAKWVYQEFGSVIPTDERGRPRTWNAGVILFTREFLDRLSLETVSCYVTRAKQTGFPSCYCTEQMFLNMVGFSPRALLTELPLGWNSQVHEDVRGGIYDGRGPQTKFVHVMFRGADHKSDSWHDSIVNGSNDQAHPQPRRKETDHE